MEDRRATSGSAMTPSALVATGELHTLAREQRLPVLLLAQYLFFLSRRPVSESNLHYLVSRLQGLKSLAPLLAGSGDAALERVVSQLGHLHPAAFRRLAPSLQLSLIPLVHAARPLPGHVVVQDSAPHQGWLADVRRALLVFGPGIGIGDELILAPVPQWLKRDNPDLEVVTLSGYRSFWNRVRAVDRDLQYSSHFDLLKALRGVPPYDGFDLVMFVDFEAPELYRGVAADGLIGKYLELSLGARSAFLFDSGQQWLYRMHHITPYFANYYHALNQLLRSLGLAPRSRDRFADIVRREEPKAGDALDIFISPFTSKYDPSGVYWSRLLSGLAQRLGPFPVRLHLDTGAHWKTQRFAIELARSVAPGLSGNVEIRLARDGTPPSLSLAGVYDQLGRSHAVICADSFAAHAGPLFDCLTLVLAKAGLRDWQVPAESSFYFDPESPVDQVANAMGALLAETLRPKSAVELAASFSQAELRMSAWADELEANLEAGAIADPGSFSELYQKFAGHHRVVAEHRGQAGKGSELLFQDSFADQIRGPDPDWDARPTAPMTLHLRDQLERWQNTNFAKYVRFATRRSAVHEDTARPASSGVAGAPAIARTGSQMGRVLLNALQSILREQLPTGEIATYFRFGSGALEYRRSPLISTFVHDALGSFDLHSRWVETDFLDALPSGAQGRFVRAAALVRSRIRKFLLWDEGNEGGWRLHGRASGAGPDPNTTACAAAVVLQAPRRKPSPRWRSHTGALREGFNGQASLLARVNTLRFLGLIGEPSAALAEEIVAGLRAWDFKSANAQDGHPLMLAFCVARAWAQASLPGRGEVAELLAPHILASVNEHRDFGGPLGAALALNACVDLDYWGPETIAWGQYLLEAALPESGWAYAPLLEHGGGSPACTSALAMTALTRSGVGR
jgi:hypothetical protein